MFKYYFNLLLLLLAVSLPGVATATETIESIQQKVDTFKASSAYQFAPATAEKAHGYLGAAMIANEANEAEKVSEGIARALATLNEASQNAERFQSQYSDLLLYKNAAEKAVSQVTFQEGLQEVNPQQLLNDAKASFNDAVSLFESGDLSNTRQRANEAKQQYIKAIDATLPTLIDETGSILSRASAAGAKNAVPKTYEAAKLELSKMERYADGLTQAVPTESGYAKALAAQSLQLAKQVKLWRKSYGSHEELYLGARDDRLKLAAALNIELDSTDSSADISIDELLQAVARLQSSLTNQQAVHKAEIAKLQAQYREELENAVSAQRSTLLSDQSEQLSSLKEAFRAKLERETFETKRQKRVRDLFEKGEVELLVNLDGSLLIRLAKLQFASGSSKVDATYYSLLGKLKEALDIYGERKVRIEGHTDSQGDVKVNQKISLKRAEAVRDFLVAATMDSSRIKALGYGEVRPVASNEFKKGRAMNRRIDIVIEAQHD